MKQFVLLWFLIMVGILHFSEQLLDVERLPLLVAISGNVVSETPIKCEITGLRGVIVEERVCRLQFLTSMNYLFFYNDIAYSFYPFATILYLFCNFIFRKSDIIFNGIFLLDNARMLLHKHRMEK